MSIIKVADMVQQMRQTTGINRPKPFRIIYCTADRKRGRGGEIRELHKAILLTKQRTADRSVNLQPLGTKDVVRVHLDLILYFNSQPVA